MIMRGLWQTTVTKNFSTRLRARIKHYSGSAIILLVALGASLPGQAHTCSARDGQTGMASWYGPGLQGNRTSSGERFDMWAMTAAHPCLPMGTKIRVTVAGTERSLVVTVNDRLPSRRRILDLSKGAARALGIASSGVALVQLLPTSSGGLAVQ